MSFVFTLLLRFIKARVIVCLVYIVQHVMEVYYMHIVCEYRIINSAVFSSVVGVIEQTVTGGGGGVKKKSAAGAKGKKPAASNAEKEEPMEKELSVSCIVNKHLSDCSL